jgi:hypothetical protein
LSPDSLREEAETNDTIVQRQQGVI